MDRIYDYPDAPEVSSIDDEAQKRAEIWHKYEKCRDYMQTKKIYTNTEKCWNMYAGHQWKGINSGGESLPIFNMIKPVVRYKVAVIASDTYTAVYSDMSKDPTTSQIVQGINEFFAQSWEKSKMDSILKDVVKYGAVQGNSYRYWSDGNTLNPPEEIPQTEIMFADENNINIQEQKFIIIRERWDLEDVRERAKENGATKEQLKQISQDKETTEQIYNKEEVTDKVTVLLYMEKVKVGEDEYEVHAGRITENVTIEPIEPIKGRANGKKLKGLSRYPIVVFPWEVLPNTARGLGEVEQMIPNQLELNKTMARWSLTVKQVAYPRLAYDASAIENPEDLDKVGVALALQGGNAQSINQMIAYLTPATMSSDVVNLVGQLLQTTKDLAGVTDYAIGDINPEQASGAAINAVREQSEAPMSEQATRLKQWVEDVALLWYDLWVAYNPEKMQIQMVSEQGMPYIMEIGHKDLRNMEMSVRVDVSPDSGWDKASQMNDLGNFLQTGMIDLVDYASLMPDTGTAIPKEKLLQVAQQKQQMAQQAQEQQMQMAQQSMELEQQKAQTDAQYKADQIDLKQQQLNADQMGAIGENFNPQMAYQSFVNSGMDGVQADGVVRGMLQGMLDARTGTKQG